MYSNKNKKTQPLKAEIRKSNNKISYYMDIILSSFSLEVVFSSHSERQGNTLGRLEVSHTANTDKEKHL